MIKLLMWGALIAFFAVAYQKVSTDATCAPVHGYEGAKVWFDYLPKPSGS